MTEPTSSTPDSTPVGAAPTAPQPQTGAAPFHRRHNGPDDAQVTQMLEALGVDSLDALVDVAVPKAIRLGRSLDLGHGIDHGLTEADALARLRGMAERNQIFRSHIGLGYHDCFTPPVIQRNVLENPGWYTAYTPYQAELAQGRLEALLNFQTLVMDLTGFDMANASLLDEATAAAEAMSLCWAAGRQKKNRFVVGANIHPQTLEVVRTRAEPLEIAVEVVPEADLSSGDVSFDDAFGLLLQYPGSDGAVVDPRPAIDNAKAAGALVTLAADPLALVLMRSPASLGADVAVGSMQRFGMPMGYGGPHAAYIATSEAYKRLLPGRVVGVSKDAAGRPALRLAMQTREQHIRRDKATSNICTAQVLPAVVASMYAVYHGPEGLRSIAESTHRCAARFADGLVAAGFTLAADELFDTVTVELDDDQARQIAGAARQVRRNLREFADTRDGADGKAKLGISFDETSTENDVVQLLELFGASVPEGSDADRLGEHRRDDAILTAHAFNDHRSETEMLRYLHRLETKDLALNVSMIPLGSCTMKLNATAEMMPITWPGFAALHPFVPSEQARGYATLCHELEDWLSEITGFAGISLQPNAGSQGEYAGLLVIRRYHEARGEAQRNVCLIPTSAHGTNPASAVMAGMKVVPVKCANDGDIDVDDLRAKAEQHKDHLAALMVTYPSTHGVFETTIRQICATVHEFGGRVYLDGANMNAQVGLCRPGDFGADVCHLNLHKTFCIPHGGGGPGMGPIGVVEDLVPYLPGHEVGGVGTEEAVGAVSAAPVGSGAILPISWAYIAMMGSAGLEQATKIAILNANYMASRLEDHFPVLYRGRGGFVAHECILDLRPMAKAAGVTVDDVAKRLIDFGFHAPTVSWPVAGTVMVEPTESESRAELDRFCDAMIAIREEARAVERGECSIEESVLRGAPHVAEDLLVADSEWGRKYSREDAAYPAAWLREFKYWAPVSRVDNAWGDRNLVCSCVGMEAFGE